MRFRDWLVLSGVSFASALGCASEVDDPSLEDPTLATADDKADGNDATEVVLTEADAGRTVTAAASGTSRS